METLALPKKKAELHNSILALNPTFSGTATPTLSLQTTILRLPPVNGITKIRLVLIRDSMARKLNSHRPVGVNLPIPHSLSHIHQKHSSILHTPPMSPRQRRHSNCLQTTRKVLIAPSPQLFILLILRPRITRPPEPLDLDIHEANLRHNVYQRWDIYIRTPEPL